MPPINTLFIVVRTADDVLVHVPFDVITLFPLLEDRVRIVAVDVMTTLDVDVEDVPPMQVNAFSIEAVPLRKAIRLAQLYNASQTGGEVEHSLLSDIDKAREIVTVLRKMRSVKLMQRVLQFYRENDYPNDVIRQLCQTA